MKFSSFAAKAMPWLTAAASIAAPGAGPLLKIGAGLLTKGLRKTISPDAGSISSAIEEAMANPDQLAVLKKIDDDFAVQMQTLGITSAEQFAQIDAEDRASARSMEIATHSRLPEILAVIVTVGFFGLLGLCAFHTMPSSSEKILDVMTGSLGTAWIMIITYYYGSSAGSDRKTELLAQAPPIPK